MRKEARKLGSRGRMLVRRSEQQEQGVVYSVPEEEEEDQEVLQLLLSHPPDPLDHQLEVLEEELLSCGEELGRILVQLGRLGSLQPVEIALEVEEDMVDGGEEEEERKVALEQVMVMHQADLEHGREGNIGMMLTLGEVGKGEELEVFRGGQKLGVVEVSLEIDPVAEVCSVGEEELGRLGLGRKEVGKCWDSARDTMGEEMEVVGHVEVEVQTAGGGRLTVRLVVLRGGRGVSLAWWATAALLLM